MVTSRKFSCMLIHFPIQIEAIKDKIANEGKIDVEGCTMVAAGLGSDKTTVSVATGQNDFHPLYIFLGGVHNNVRRAHRGAVAVLAFLSIVTGITLLHLQECKVKTTLT